MARDAVATMGTILPDDAGGRDAVHVAVASAVSDVRLRPGQDVGIELVEGRDVKARAVSGTTEGVGKVDPFLDAIVEPGQRFWLYLYPRSITSLNHNWSHPAFPDAKPGEQYNTPAQKLASENWLRNFCEQNSFSYERLVNAAADDHAKNDEGDGYVYTRKDGEYLHFNGTDAHGEIPPELWGHVETVTGKKITQRPEYFSCSC